MKSRLLVLTIAVSFLSLCLTIGMVAQADEWAATLTATSNNAGEEPDYKFNIYVIFMELNPATDHSLPTVCWHDA